MENNFNGYNNQNNYNPEQQDQQTQSFYNDYSAYRQNNVNEFVYRPEQKKSRARKVLIGITALLAAAAIGVTSIVGYTLVTGDKIGTTTNASVEETEDAEEGATAKNEAENKKNKDSAKVNKEVPTIVQLASPDDAMKIPDIVTKVSPSVVGISCMTNRGAATGTGIIMSEDGYIITNAHVVSDAQTIQVLLPKSYADENSSEEDLTVKAQLVGKDTQTDIAVLKIDKKGLTKAEFGKSSDLKVGEVAIVIGNPLGFELANSVTAGIISALDRTINIEDRTMNTIQTDASINNGNSGGPLINAYGQVIGITSAKVTSSYGEGLGFAIPIDEAIPIVKELIAHGYVTGRPTLGVSGENVSNVYAQYYNIPKGFFVKKVNPGSAAEKAGIKVDDIVIGIEGKLIESMEEFNKIKKNYKAGDTIKVSVYRDKKIIDLDVTLDEAVAEDNNSSSNKTDDDSYNPYDEYRKFFNQFPY